MQATKKYLGKESCNELIEKLQDPNLNYEENRKEVNDLIINLVVKYALEYLEIEHKTISKTRHQIKKIIRKNINTDAQTYNTDHAKSDLYPLNCLLDIRKTAAIVKEIIFNKSKNDNDTKLCLDLGSGTGILLLASIISELRKKAKKIIAVGIDHNKPATEQSQKTLNKLFHEREQVSIKIVRGSLINLFNIKELEENKENLSTWVSETINPETPLFDTNNDNIEIDFHGLNKIQEYIDIDPFPLCIANTLDEFPDFYKKVKNQEIFMFPDCITGKYKPHDTKGESLLLETSRLNIELPLKYTSAEFLNYEELYLNVPPRWN